MPSFSWNSRASGCKRGVACVAVAIILLLTLPLLFADFLGETVIPFDRWMQYLSTSQTYFSSSREMNNTIEEENPLKADLARLLRGDDLEKLITTGFGCDIAEYSLVCVANQPVVVDTTRNITVHAPTNPPLQQESYVRPYARQQDKVLLQYITPVKILHENTTPPVCQYNHQIPAVIFSTGLIGNLFHEFNEIIIPLFITIKHFKSQVLPILEDYYPPFVSKYSKILGRLSGNEVMNPAANGSVHCFPSVIVGLKYHGNLALNASDIPGGYSMADFRQFLRETYDLKSMQVSYIRKPMLMLISREKTRRFLNEDEIVVMMKQVGFGVVVVRTQESSNLDKFANVVNSCSVLVGVHGAGLTNLLFLPGGAVTIQVEPLGLEWASATYFGEPAGTMDLYYLRYKITPEESSLLQLYGQNHSVITEPASVFAKGYAAARAVYIDQQDVRLDILKFRDTLLVALELLRNSSFAG